MKIRNVSNSKLIGFVALLFLSAGIGLTTFFEGGFFSTLVDYPFISGFIRTVIVIYFFLAVGFFLHITFPKSIEKIGSDKEVIIVSLLSGCSWSFLFIVIRGWLATP